MIAAKSEFDGAAISPISLIVSLGGAGIPSKTNSSGSWGLPGQIGLMSKA
ncbi:MAG: hypothetical protein SO210_08825 [Bacteroidaceae bacterium]|nr:hypothetical protein [Bacteroidaceae bacterium]